MWKNPGKVSGRLWGNGLTVGRRQLPRVSENVVQWLSSPVEGPKMSKMRRTASMQLRLKQSSSACRRLVSEQPPMAVLYRSGESSRRPRKPKKPSYRAFRRHVQWLRLPWECLHNWCWPWSSKPVEGLNKALSGFDSHTLPLFFNLLPERFPFWFPCLGRDSGSPGCVHSGNPGVMPRLPRQATRPSPP
jgi:hypothetical protein